MAERDQFVDYYELLGVATNAEPKQIRVAYIRHAKQHHPDIGGETADMQQFNMAYRTLMSASSRKSYDLLYDFHTGRSVIHYRDNSKQTAGSPLDDLSDKEIDDFIDTIYAEYRAQPKPKVTFITRLRKFI